MTMRFAHNKVVQGSGHTSPILAEYSEPFLKLEDHTVHESLTCQEQNGSEIKKRCCPQWLVSVSADYSEVGITIPVWPLAAIVLALLITSHVLLFQQCHAAYSTAKEVSFIRGQYKVVQSSPNASQTSQLYDNSTSSSLSIVGEPEESTGHHVRNILHPGKICETLEKEVVVKNGTEFYCTIYPTAGFISKQIIESDLELVHYYNTTDPSTYDTGSIHGMGMCPLVYSGWWPVQDEVESYLYALIVSQCLWNGCQVLCLFLLLALLYDQLHTEVGSSEEGSYKIYCQRYLVVSISLASTILLPFSVYVIRLTLLTTIIGLTATPPSLSLSVRENTIPNSDSLERADENGSEKNEQANTVSRTSSESMPSEEMDEDEVVHVDQSSCTDVETSFMFMNLLPTDAMISDINDKRHDNDGMCGCGGAMSRKPTRVIREETVGFLGNLFCHMYNYREPWKSVYFYVDGLLGLKKVGDVTPADMYTLGFSDTRIPLFVSQASHTTTGAHVFTAIWSVLPFIYVAYFGIMFLVAHKSPGPVIQRIICLYSMFHFLFFTDVVAYRYGRGYRNTHESSFHWSEHWAWRAGILLPIYQNCTNGHWDNHPTHPKAGKIFKIIVAAYGVWFLLFQVIQGDAFQFVNYLSGLHHHTFFEMVGWDENPVIVKLDLNKQKEWATLVMTIMYGFLHVSGFPQFWVCLNQKENLHECTESRNEGKKCTKNDDSDHAVHHGTS